MGKPSNYLFWFPPYHVWLPKGSKVILQPPLSFLWSLCAVSGREKLDVAATSQLDALYWPTSRSLIMVVPIMPVYSTPALNYAWSNWQLQGVLRTVIYSTSCTISVTWISLGDSLFFKCLTRQVVTLQRPRIRIAVVHLPVVSKLWNPFEGPGCQPSPDGLQHGANTEPTRSQYGALGVPTCSRQSSPWPTSPWYPARAKNQNRRRERVLFSTLSEWYNLLIL